MAAAVGLRPEEIRTDGHAPVVASVGLPFVIAEVADLDALARARPDAGGLERLAAAGASTPDVHLYVRDSAPGGPATGGAGGAGARGRIRARMFAPFDGVVEDPATGSANGALAALLASVDPSASGQYAWQISQGVEMGRPSVLDARVHKVDGHVSDVWIGGESVLIAEGFLEA